MGDKEHLVALIRFGVFEVDARSGEVRKAGVRIKLQDQPFKVLLTLLDHPGEVITREDLRARIWPNESFGGLRSCDECRHRKAENRFGGFGRYAAICGDVTPAGISFHLPGGSREWWERCRLQWEGRHDRE
jgi:Transcriptional regulatory protein, C terminal